MGGEEARPGTKGTKAPGGRTMLRVDGLVRDGLRFLSAVCGWLHVIFKVAVVRCNWLTIGHDGWNQDDCNQGKTQKKIRPHGKSLQ